MAKMNKFKKTIQTEICNLIKAPIKFNNNQILSNKKYEEKKEVKIYQMKSNSIIVTAPSLYDDINKEINNIGKDIRVDIEQLKNSLKLDKHKVGNKTIYLFLNPNYYKELVFESEYRIFRIDKEYKKEFEEFKSECSKKDLDEGLVSIEDPIVFGCFHKNRLIGVTSYWFWGDNLADIGVVIHPEYRQQGIGKALVSKLCNWGIKNKKINLYRHNEMNRRSHQLALSLNFKEYLFVEEMKL